MADRQRVIPNQAEPTILVIDDRAENRALVAPLCASLTPMLVQDLRAPRIMVSGYAERPRSGRAQQPDDTRLRDAAAIDDSAKRVRGPGESLDLSTVDVGSSRS